MIKEKEILGQEETKMIEDEKNIGDTVDFMKIKLSKTYKFEGKEIEEIDMSGLEDLTGGDMLAINRMMKRRGNTDASPEVTLEFAMYAAMQATNLPLEFFNGLNMKDSMKVKARVKYFLMY